MVGYDVSKNPTYFVTICVKDRAWVFGDIIRRGDPRLALRDAFPPTVELTEYGVIVEQFIKSIPDHYQNVGVPHYVIMPNHVHILLHIDTSSDGGMWSSRPTLQNVIRTFKSLTRKSVGFAIWQDSFHDHIIRSERDYLFHRKYIANNPSKWLNDVYYRDK
jgi:REP element-mobilizing transposase RayT